MKIRLDINLILWLLILLAVFTIATLYILTISGFGDMKDEMYQSVYSEINHQLPKHQDVYVETLKNEIKYLKEKVGKLEKLLNEHSSRTIFNTTTHLKLSSTQQAPNHSKNIQNVNFDCISYIRKQAGAAEILHGHPFNNEFELIPFNHFTFNRIYPIHLGLAKRVVERPIGRIREELLDVLSKALDSLNKNVTSGNYSRKRFNKYMLIDFLEGLYRIDPKTGTQYELYFQRPTNGGIWTDVKKVTILKPFAPLHTIELKTFYNPLLQNFAKTISPNIIHIIVPLSGRLAQLSFFLKNFVKIFINKDQLINLTVVYFGIDGFMDARRLMGDASIELKEKGLSIQMIQGNQTFNRAKGLQIGVESCVDLHKTTKLNILLFLCDVDIIFNDSFLNRCRWNTEPGKKVYYPVVFSLFNPKVVYTLQGKTIPDEMERMQISKENGFWRDFGFGMTCQYRSDFLKLGGFDEEIIGWGGEDVMLYRKYVRSNIKVVRATDPGIFHMWHPKVCAGDEINPKLSLSQYRACIRSRALNEASHAQLGFLAFRDEIAAQTNNFTLI